MTALSQLTAAQVIALLELRPHPEGGHFRETFRDSGGGARSHSTAIYFLLAQGEISRWHRVDAAEVWHWYAGAPLELAQTLGGEAASIVRLGPALESGERPQAVVPAGHWQRARSSGDWSLVGCTVAPGFDFAGFEIAENGFDPEMPTQRAPHNVA